MCFTDSSIHFRQHHYISLRYKERGSICRLEAVMELEWYLALEGPGQLHWFLHGFFHAFKFCFPRAKQYR